MTPVEAQLMQKHALYWRELMGRRLAVVFGLVSDPAGAYGIGVVELDDDADPHAVANDDPTIKANVGFRIDIQPMRAVVRP
jgi:uncharacterized protein